MIRVTIEVVEGDFSVKTETKEVSKVEAGLFLLAMKRTKQEVLGTLKEGAE